MILCSELFHEDIQSPNINTKFTLCCNRITSFVQYHVLFYPTLIAVKSLLKLSKLNTKQ